jgi:hypothetical protein
VGWHLEHLEDGGTVVRDGHVANRIHQHLKAVSSTSTTPPTIVSSHRTACSFACAREGPRVFLS